jgi:hypothetical protein
MSGAFSLFQQLVDVVEVETRARVECLNGLEGLEVASLLTRLERTEDRRESLSASSRERLLRSAIF